MPEITIRVFGPVRDRVGKGIIKLEIKDNQTLIQVINSLIVEYHSLSNIILSPKNSEPKQKVNFLLNGKSITLPKDASKKLRNGDILAILPPVGGG